MTPLAVSPGFSPCLRVPPCSLVQDTAAVGAVDLGLGGIIWQRSPLGWDSHDLAVLITPSLLPYFHLLGPHFSGLDWMLSSTGRGCSGHW